VDFNPQEITPFRSLGGASIKVRRPITKAAFQVLAERHPRTIGFPELFEAALERVPERWRFGDAAAVRAALAQDVLECYTLGGLELRTTQPALTPEISDRPRMSPLAAHQAQAGKERVVNRYHRQIRIGPLARKLAPLLDGEHDRAALVEHTKSLVQSGNLPMVRNGRPVTDPDGAQDALEDAVGQALGNLAAASLLIA